MPTVNQFFQPPLYWQQFEELANGLLGEIYNIPDAQQFGRPGQAQNGVDVYGRSKRYGMIGVQCKRLADLDPNGNPYPGGPINRKFLRDAADEALVFKPTLAIWILATTARRDTTVQGWVNEINDEWEAQGRNRRAMVWSWDDIIGYLNAFPELQRWYYSEVIKIFGSNDIDNIILSTIAMAFSRPAFEVPFLAETYDDFLQALADTQRALRTGELLDRESRHVIRKAVGGWREVDNLVVRDGLSLVNSSLRQLRTQMEQGLRDGKIQRINGFIEFNNSKFYKEVVALRKNCIEILNDVLSIANMPPIN